MNSSLLLSHLSLLSLQTQTSQVHWRHCCSASVKQLSHAGTTFSNTRSARHALCGGRLIAGRFSCAARPCCPAGVSNWNRISRSPPTARGTPPGYLRVGDLVGAPLSRASLYREISSGNLSAVRSRAGILVREDDYARGLADAAALHSTDVANAADEARDD